MHTVSAIQMASGPNVSANLSVAEKLIQLAADQGAKLIVLPENFAVMPGNPKEALNEAEPFAENGPLQKFLSNIARKYGIWLVGGTIPLKSSEPNRYYGASLLYNDQGECVARYNKMHLFDVTLPDSDEQYRESDYTKQGKKLVVAETPFGKLGMSVCYDLRFPELFRGLLDMGAEIIVMPASFTAMTGRAHWESLVRARAIENLTYFIAAAQGGYHISGRETHGDSMIVDPWGSVLNRMQHGAGAVVANIDLARMQSIRKVFPSIHHRRLSCAVSDS